MTGDLPPALEQWLLATDDPSVRWRLLSELGGRPEGDPELEECRRQVGRRGWAHSILANQLASGQWDAPGTGARELYVPKYIATNWRLLVLSDLGATRGTPGVERAAELMLTAEDGPKGGLGGEGSEVCFTGNAVRMFTRLGYADDPRIVRSTEWLVQHQKADGGWHCFPSESGTIDCWEALAAFAALPTSRRTSGVEEAIRRGAEFYLSGGLLGEREGPYAPWLRAHYPVHYYYDFLVGLDTLTRLGFGADPRIDPAVDHLVAQRSPEGTWNLGPLHPDIPPEESVNYRIEAPYYPFALEWTAMPSRWLTLTALAVLRRVRQARAGN